MHCLISFPGGLGSNPFVMAKTTRDPHSQKERIGVRKNLTLGVNRANIEQDTAIQK